MTALRILGGIVSAYTMSSGRLGPPSRAPSCRRRRNDASPPGPETESTALPMTGPLDRGPGRRGVRPGLAALAEPARGERGQERRPCRRRDRVSLLEHLQAAGLGRGAQLGGIGRGEVAQRGARNVQRLVSTGKGRGGTHLGHLLHGGSSLLLTVSSREGRL
jgi:hypothetical protein